MISPEARRRLRRLEITTRRQVDDYLAGRYTSLFKGRGVEFSEVREYQPGDDVRSIDWNVTARRGEPYVKKNTEERELTLVLAVDLSASQDFGTGPRSKRDLALEVAALLAFSALRNGDKVGLLLFTDRVEKFVPPRKGRRHCLRLVREVLEPAPTGRGTDLALALGYLDRVQKRRTVVFLLSDFLGCLPHRDLRVTCRRHDVSALCLADPGEFSLPAVGRLRLRDLETGRVALVDSSDPDFRQRYTQAARQRRRDLRRHFERSGADFGEFSTEGSVLTALLAFFAEKQARHRYDRRRA